MTIKRIDLSGQRFGMLVAIEPIRDAVFPRFNWLCKCDCGNTKVVRSSQLQALIVKSCGCLKKVAAKKAGAANVTHGMTKTKAFSVWKGMLERCSNKNSSSFKNYGGRGISVCDRWKMFENFFSDMGNPPPKKQIDRIDSNGNYDPENCRWVSCKENQNNRINNRIYSLGSISKTASEWAESLGITRVALIRRVDVLCWDIERALTERKTK